MRKGFKEGKKGRDRQINRQKDRHKYVHYKETESIFSKSKERKKGRRGGGGRKEGRKEEERKQEREEKQERKKDGRKDGKKEKKERKKEGWKKERKKEKGKKERKTERINKKVAYKRKRMQILTRSSYLTNTVYMGNLHKTTFFRLQHLTRCQHHHAAQAADNKHAETKQQKYFNSSTTVCI